MHVVILSRSENTHADLIQKNCDSNASVDRINFDFETHDSPKLPFVLFGDKTSSISPDAIFVHHPRISYKNEWFADDIERKLFVASWDSVKEWMESQFPKARWVNRPSANFASRNVFKQLQIAKALELQVPETLFTNNTEELLKFAGSNMVVIKQGNLGVHIENKRILTSLVDVSSVDQALLRGCPCLFQKYVAKQFELRVHVIGNDVLTCKIYSQANPKTKIDWRNYDLDNTPHEAYEIESKLRDKCISIVRNLGLLFGIIDLIITPQGECIFLECNAQGHWYWIEKLTGLPITEVLCNYLLSNSSI
jgi:hypothetical protein